MNWIRENKFLSGFIAILVIGAGALGYLGVNLPEQYGGGGGGMYELALVLEELSAAGCSQLMMVVSPAICGTVIGRFGTPAQKQHWLPGIADWESVFEEAGWRLVRTHRIDMTVGEVIFELE